MYLFVVIICSVSGVLGNTGVVGGVNLLQACSPEGTQKHNNKNSVLSSIEAL